MRALIAAVVVMVGWGLSVFGQVPGEGGVTAMGMATVKRPPELLRVQVQLSAEGKTVREALSKLAARKEACRKKLIGLGAKAEAITFEDARVEGPDPRQAQMEMMMRARRGGVRPPTTGPAGGAGAAAAQKVAVIVKAEWPLAEAKTAEDLLVMGAELQAKVKAADVADTKLASLEEQEAREEVAGMGNEDGAPAPGEPVFAYVAKVGDAERARAMAEAFAKAKASAAELAKAAGVELGGLRQATSQASAEADPMQMMRYGRYNPYAYGQMMMNTGEGSATNEALAAQPGPVTLRITVSATFGVK
jgi:uncharacterized protein YggE